MEFLKGFLIVVEVVTAALLVCLILVQKTKGGMGTAMGGMGEQVFGSRMGNVLTKATVWLISIFLINTIIIARMGSTARPESVTDLNPAPAAQQPAAVPQPTEPAPAIPPPTSGTLDFPVEADGATGLETPMDDAATDASELPADATPEVPEEPAPSAAE